MYNVLILAKMVRKGCINLQDVQQNGGDYFSSVKDKLKQGSCFTQTTLESKMSGNFAERYKGCGELTAMACICNTNDCNNITIDEKIPQVVSDDQRSYRLLVAIERKFICRRNAFNKVLRIYY